MFSYFIFMPKEVSKEHIYPKDIIANLRKHKIKSHQIETLSEKGYSHPGLKYPQQKALWNEFIEFTSRLTNYSIYPDIRNLYDLDFFIQDIEKLRSYHSKFFTVEQGYLILQFIEDMKPFLEQEFWQSTKEEKWRKSVIELAGFEYTQHIYPDYRGCDELFYDMPQGPEDTILHHALEELKRKNIHIPLKP